MKPDTSVSNVALFYYFLGGQAPKGAIIGHNSLLLSVHETVNLDSENESTGVSLVNSPLAVSSALYNLLLHVVRGSRVAIFTDITRTFELAPILHPTGISCVPQMWTVFFKTYQAQLAMLRELAAEATCVPPNCLHAHGLKTFRRSVNELHIEDDPLPTECSVCELAMGAVQHRCSACFYACCGGCYTLDTAEQTARRLAASIRELDREWPRSLGVHRLCVLLCCPSSIFAFS